MVIQLPTRGVVFINGASCTGKTTLAQQILRENPITNKDLHSNDVDLLEIMKQMPELAPYVASLQATGAMSMPSAMTKYLPIITSGIYEHLFEMVKTYDFVVHEGVLSDERLLEDTLEMIFWEIKPAPVVLVSILPEPKVHEKMMDLRQKSGKVVVANRFADVNTKLRSIMSDLDVPPDVKICEVVDPFDIKLGFYES